MCTKNYCYLHFKSVPYSQFNISCSFFSESMGEVANTAQDWNSFVQQIQENDSQNVCPDSSQITLSRIKQNLTDSGFLEQAIFPELALEIQPELNKLCREYALPINLDSSPSIYNTLCFYNTQEVDCYCRDTEKTGAVFADCQVLKGGNHDKTYYIALTHETLIREHKAGMTVLRRFDPSTSKEAMTILCLTLWELIQTLAKLENIDLEHITPYYPNIVRSAHVTLCILPCNMNKETLVDIPTQFSPPGQNYWTLPLDISENSTQLNYTLLSQGTKATSTGMLALSSLQTHCLPRNTQQT